MSRAVGLLVTAICLSLVGCTEGGGSPGGAPVSGTITYDTKPMSNAVLSFIPTGSTIGHGGVAVADQEGKFSVKTAEGKEGIPAGQYKVVVSKFVNPDGSDFIATPDKAPIDSGATEMVPLKYSDAEKTTLTANVPESGTTDLKFDLTSK